MRQCAITLLICSASLAAQERAGELRASVTDASGAGLQAICTLTSPANRFSVEVEGDSQGYCLAKKLPFGRYRLQVERAGFAAFVGMVEISSELPVVLSVSLNVAPRSESITVQDRESEGILDTTNTGTAYTLGKLTLQSWASTNPGRGVIDVVNAQPGWLVEANGVLHPRGLEYATQYVVDGIPILENRSPAFAPGQETEDLQTMKIYTSGIPAEFGRKLGGVIETVSERNSARGFHGTAVLNGGSFDTAEGYLGLSYFDGRDLFGLSGTASHTDRFLDPPAQQNFTNAATSSGLRGSFERDLTQKDRLRVAVSHSKAGFQVPNEQVQESAGQRQDRQEEETAGQISYQHIFTPSLLGSVQARVRDLAAGLESNPESVPIEAFQQRGFRDGYVSASLSAQLGHHNLKTGADGIYSSLHEAFSYQITSTGGFNFDPSTPPSFSFSGAGLDREQAFYAQDQMRFGNVSVEGGIRFDHYSLRVDETAWSPRLGIAWYSPKLGLVLRGSYDRIFSTPASENLLLSTSADVRTLNQTVAQLPVRPSLGNYYEGGATKDLAHKARLSANYFWRDLKNVGDDDILLNTGISFPIALRSTAIYGVESQLALQKWGPFSGWISYSYMVAKEQLPVTGGLFLGNDAASLLNSTQTIWSTQDQRHTAHGLIRYQPLAKLWMALGASYGSGLPLELNGEDTATLVQEFGQAVVDRVNLSAGRVRPSSSLDFSAGVEVFKKEARVVHLQADLRNMTDRLNVINFNSLFSGTALASPRALSARVRFDF